MGHMRKQAERFGADIRRGTVTRADLSSRPFHLVVDGEKQIEADSLIIATALRRAIWDYPPRRNTGDRA